MKKIISLTFLMVMISSASAFAEVDLKDDADSITLGSSEMMFKISTNGQLRCDATDTEYTAASKHISGGTTMFGTTESSTELTEAKGLEPDDEVDAQTAGTDPVLTAA